MMMPKPPLWKLTGGIRSVIYRPWTMLSTWQTHHPLCLCFSCVVEKPRVPAAERHQARIDFAQGKMNPHNDATLYARKNEL